MIGQLLGSDRVVATVQFDDIDLAPPTVAALSEGGVNVVEVLHRTDVAFEAIRRIRSENPDAIVGAGTILDVEGLEGAVEAGAMFVVSPGFAADIAARASDVRVPFVPGAVTATEIQACLQNGFTTVKFFPASTMGGPDALRSLAATFSAANVQFIPTGGIDDNNAMDYLALPTVRAIGMSWIATAASIREGAFDEITTRAKQISSGAMGVAK